MINVSLNLQISQYHSFSCLVYIVKNKMNKNYSLVLLVVLGLVQLTSTVQAASSQKNGNLNCKCRFGIQKRIVGGSKATKNLIPWMVSLGVEDRHYCGVSYFGEILFANLVI